MITLEEFNISQKSLVVYHGAKKVFESNASDLEPLMRYTEQFGTDQSEPTIFDKYTGRAAALIMTLIGPLKVYTGIISEGGAKVFDENGIPFEAGEQVDYLMGVASKDMCRWEKMSLGKSPQELLDTLNAHFSK